MTYVFYVDPGQSGPACRYRCGEAAAGGPECGACRATWRATPPIPPPRPCPSCGAIVEASALLRGVYYACRACHMHFGSMVTPDKDHEWRMAQLTERNRAWNAIATSGDR
jgi:hypothetical protein